MSESIISLTEHELSALIANASKELENKRTGKRQETILKIHELAASIGIHVQIYDDYHPSKRISSVPVKYRDPNDSDNAWSGRGMKPRWLKAYLDAGRSIEEFKV